MTTPVRRRTSALVVPLPVRPVDPNGPAALPQLAKLQQARGA